MDSLRSAYDHHAFIFWLALLVLWIFGAFWLLMTQRRSARAEARLDALFADVDEGNTAQRLAEYLTIVRQTAADMSRLKTQHEQILSIVPSVIRHVGLVRFSPFHDTGGDQSFTLALLDGKRDGVVVTGLHSRTDSRLYAKPIADGSSEYALTPEEQEAMSVALHGSSQKSPRS